VLVAFPPPPLKLPGNESSTSIHDIKTLILSFNPVIVMETVEEDRVFSVPWSTAMELEMPLFE
jgi:hypothetical protein